MNSNHGWAPALGRKGSRPVAVLSPSVYRPLSDGEVPDRITNEEAARQTVHTGPAQKISLGHHACLGGRGTCEGSAEFRGADGLATAVETVMEGTPVLMAPDGAVALDTAWGMP